MSDSPAAPRVRPAVPVSPAGSRRLGMVAVSACVALAAWGAVTSAGLGQSLLTGAVRPAWASAAREPLVVLATLGVCYMMRKDGSVGGRLLGVLGAFAAGAAAGYTALIPLFAASRIWDSGPRWVAALAFAVCLAVLVPAFVRMPAGRTPSRRTMVRGALAAGAMTGLAVTLPYAPHELVFLSAFSVMIPFDLVWSAFLALSIGIAAGIGCALVPERPRSASSRLPSHDTVTGGS